MQLDTRVKKRSVRRAFDEAPEEIHLEIAEKGRKKGGKKAKKASSEATAKKRKYYWERLHTQWRWAYRARKYDEALALIDYNEKKAIARENAEKWYSRIDAHCENKWKYGEVAFKKATEIASKALAEVDDWNYNTSINLAKTASIQQREALDFATSPTNTVDEVKIEWLFSLSFVEFVDEVFPSYQWPWHLKRLASVLQRIADGEIKRLMIFMPPRHGKTQLIKLFAAYLLASKGQYDAGLISYSSSLAESMSRAARDYFLEIGGELRDDTKAVKLWRSTLGGGVLAAGILGSVMGFGFNALIIDDPVKNAEEAHSLTIQKRTKANYDSSLKTRLADPNAAIILIQTRWNQADLAGQLLDSEGKWSDDGSFDASSHPERWHIVCYEALRVADRETYFKFPSTCTLESDPREIGEALWPSKFDAEYLLALKALNEYFFNALYQQKPTLAEGLLIKRAWFEIVNELPEGRYQRIRYWDFAGTEGGGKYTVGLLIARHRQTKIYYIEDVKRGQWGIDKRNEIIKQTAAFDKERYGARQVRTYGEQEGGSGGKQAAQFFKEMLKKFPPVNVDVPTGSKIIRAIPAASRAASGGIKLLKADWNENFLLEVAAFPNGLSDQVDAMSGAVNMMQSRGHSGSVGDVDAYNRLFS